MLGSSPLGRPLLRAPGPAAPAVLLLHGAAGPAWRQPGCERSQLRLLCAAAGYRGSAPQRAAPLPSAAPANVRPPQPAPCKLSGVALLMWSLLMPAVRITDSPAWGLFAKLSWLMLARHVAGRAAGAGGARPGGGALLGAQPGGGQAGRRLAQPADALCVGYVAVCSRGRPCCPACACSCFGFPVPELRLSLCQSFGFPCVRARAQGAGAYLIWPVLAEGEREAAAAAVVPFLALGAQHLILPLMGRAGRAGDHAHGRARAGRGRAPVRGPARAGGGVAVAARQGPGRRRGRQHAARGAVPGARFHSAFCCYPSQLA